MDNFTTAVNKQRYLKTKGFYKGNLDGIWGTASERALMSFLESRAGKLTFNYKFATPLRRHNAAWQLFCYEAGITEVGAIDGFIGPSTRDAIETLEYIDKNGKRPALWREDDDTEPELPIPLKVVWPRQKEVEKYYGKIGENQTMLVPPYTHKLTWDQGTVLKRFSIHEKCHDSALRVLNRALAHYGPDRLVELRLDLFSGCLNPRLMRGGTEWSMHSWGIAIDYDDVNNQLKWGRDKAEFAKPAYEVWWRLWEEEGWLSLGRTKNFDWMHVQAARLG